MTVARQETHILHQDGIDASLGEFVEQTVGVGEFIVVDENRNPIESSRDNLGFLASRGAINMKEYFKAPELTAKATAGA